MTIADTLKRPGWMDRIRRMRDPVVVAELAAALPLRTILHEHGPYLSRYTLADLPDGGHVYLHFFHTGDVDRDLHSHPWSGASTILTGGYVEERREGHDDSEYRVVTRTCQPGDESVLAVDTFHRVDLLEPTGCWTLFTAGPKAESWGFWNRDTGTFTPWRLALARRGL
jgi:hypothetical protein